MILHNSMFPNTNLNKNNNDDNIINNNIDTIKVKKKIT